VGVPSPLPPPRFIAPSLLAKAGCKAINKGTGTERKNNKIKKQTATTRQKKIKGPLPISTFSYFILSHLQLLLSRASALLLFSFFIFGSLSPPPFSSPLALPLPRLLLT